MNYLCCFVVFRAGYERRIEGLDVDIRLVSVGVGGGLMSRRTCGHRRSTFTDAALVTVCTWSSIWTCVQCRGR